MKGQELNRAPVTCTALPTRTTILADNENNGVYGGQLASLSMAWRLTKRSSPMHCHVSSLRAWSRDCGCTGSSCLAVWAWILEVHDPSDSLHKRASPDWTGEL